MAEILKDIPQRGRWNACFWEKKKFTVGACIRQGNAICLERLERRRQK